MYSKVSKVLSFGSKLEKYALTAKAVAGALKQLDTDLKEIWGNSQEKPTVSTVVETGKKLLKKDEKTKENEKG